jgi:hypothetical protein
LGWAAAVRLEGVSSAMVSGVQGHWTHLLQVWIGDEKIDHGLPHWFRHDPSFSSLLHFLLEYEVTTFFPFMQIICDIVVCNFCSISSGLGCSKNQRVISPTMEAGNTIFNAVL